MFDFQAYFDVGLTYSQFLERYGSFEHQRRWRQAYAQIRLNPQQRALLDGFRRELRLLCMAGAWCGDCVEQCTLLQHLASACPRIELRLVDRDAHPELRERLVLCGAPRVPQVVFLSELGDFAGLAGDRPLAKYRQMAVQVGGAACPAGLAAPETQLQEKMLADWLHEIERIQWMLRLSGKLRELHGD